jgi:hypothetical protein
MSCFRLACRSFRSPQLFVLVDCRSFDYFLPQAPKKQETKAQSKPAKSTGGGKQKKKVTFLYSYPDTVVKFLETWVRSFAVSVAFCTFARV